MKNLMQSPVDLIKDMTCQNIEWVNTLQKLFSGPLSHPANPIRKTPGIDVPCPHIVKQLTQKKEMK